MWLFVKCDPCNLYVVTGFQVCLQTLFGNIVSSGCIDVLNNRSQTPIHYTYLTGLHKSLRRKSAEMNEANNESHSLPTSVVNCECPCRHWEKSGQKGGIQMFGSRLIKLFTADVCSYCLAFLFNSEQFGRLCICS